MNPTLEIAAVAARLVVDEGMEHEQAKRRAAREFGPRAELPDAETLEDAVREHIALFCADTQPAELRALRELAAVWMRRLAAFRPHLAGAVWRGTATRLSAVRLELYADDEKAPEIALLNAGVAYDVGSLPAPGGRGPREEISVLTLASPCPALGEPATLHLLVLDHDALRGALKPDSRGRAWRGDLAAVEALLAAGERA